MLKTIIVKELKRVFSDRRLIFSVLLLPGLMIFAMYSIMGVMLDDMISNVNQHVGRAYVLNAPELLIQYTNSIDLDMEIQYITEEANIENIKESIRGGSVDLLVEFDQEFMSEVENYTQVVERPEVKTFYNPSEDYSSQTRHTYINAVLSGFEEQILVDRFGNLGHIRAFDIDRDPNEGVIQDDKKATGKGLAMIMPMLITIFLFAGAMGVGTDTIAGEKERGTMATLLLTPVKRETIALGKVISLGIVSIISAVITFVAMIASMPFAGSMYTGSADANVNIGALQFGPLEYIQLLLIMVTLVGIFVGIICLISVRARTVKEANAYVMPVYFVVVMAAISNMFTSGNPEPTKFMIPIYNGVLSLKALLEFNLTMQQFSYTIGSSVLVIVILIGLISKTFNDEKVMLNA